MAFVEGGAVGEGGEGESGGEEWDESGFRSGARQRGVECEGW